MKFTFKKLGPIDHAELELAPLTIICGANNTGKTYVSYSVYALLENLPRSSMLSPSVHELRLESNILDDLRTKKSASIDLEQYREQMVKVFYNRLEEYPHQLDYAFGAAQGVFKHTHVHLHLNPELDITRYPYKDVYFSDFHLEMSKKYQSNKGELSLFGEITTESQQELIETAIKNFVYHSYIEQFSRTPFVITAERTGIELFQKELDATKSKWVEQLKRNPDPQYLMQQLSEQNTARYASTIQENIGTVRMLSQIRKRFSMFLDDEVNINIPQTRQLLVLLGKLLNGSFKDVNGDTHFVPHHSTGSASAVLPMYLASSSVKSLVLLDAFIRHIAKPNHLLIIDEPELNLHPKNQVLMARLLATLANAGIYVLITTHSDFIVREINHLMMLSQAFEDKASLMQRFGYDKAEVLSPDKVALYVAEDNTLKPAPKDSFGFQLDNFDDVILNQGDITSALTFALEG